MFAIILMCNFNEFSWGKGVSGCRNGTSPFSRCDHSDADNSEDTIFYVVESMHSYKNVESLIIFRIKESKKST